VRITSKGQVTIPQAIRERAGLMPGTDVEFVLVAAEAGATAAAAAVEVRLRKARPPAGRATRGARLVERLRGRASYAMSTDEIVALMRGAPADAETSGDGRPE
jgi:AbrB family looped-hinge helix DNA binding protein